MAIIKIQKEVCMKKYYTWKDMESYLADLARMITLDSFTPDVVIGPGRGGYIPGVMLSHYLNIPFEGFEWQTRDGSFEDSTQLKSILDKHNNKDILVIDDINDTGTTLTGIANLIDKNRLYSDIRYATIFNKQSSSFDEVDYYAEEIELDDDNWIVFPYEEWWK
jgi:hypoxanthine phosphoribosyltransferase